MSIEKRAVVAAWETSMSTDEYRLKQLTSGGLILQRGIEIRGSDAEGKLYGRHEWKDIPTVVEE